MLDRNFKFGKQVDRSKSYPTDGKPSLKGAWSCQANHLNVGGHQPYLWNGLSYSRHILYAGRLYQVPAYGGQINLEIGVVRVT